MLRLGTMVTIGLVAVGYAVAPFGAAPPDGPVPLLQLVGRDAPSTLIGLGLLGLALIPVVMLAVAAVALASLRERRMAVISALVALLLVGALVAAVAFAAAG